MNNELERQKNILIVDDSPVNIKILQATLMSDYEISVTTDGAEAIEIATSRAGLSGAADLILLDITMPEMDGYEVCRQLKADKRTFNIPVIFITARSEEKEETKGFELGAVDYIRKPFSPAVVRARVKTQLELKAHRDNLEQLNAILKNEITERKRSEEALKKLLKKQEFDIGLAKKILNLLNGDVPRYTDISEDKVLFADAISIPCYMEGGDHFFVRNYSDYFQCDIMNHQKKQCKKTVISLKDQSGHEVTCVLRSIITDLIHKEILTKSFNTGGIELEQAVSELNDEICRCGMFDQEDFFTSVNAEIDHETLRLRYISAGHPPFLLIRGDSVEDFPKFGDPGTNMPIAVSIGINYSAGEFQLQEGDKLIFYTDGLTEMPIRNYDKMIGADEFKTLVSEIICHLHSQQPLGQELSVSDISYGILQAISKMSHEEIVLPNYDAKSKNTSGDDVTLLCLEIEKKKYNEVSWKPQDYTDISRHIAELAEKIESEWNHQDYEACKQLFRLVLEEAVVNAWKHGNKKDPEKSIIVRWRYGNDFCLEVIDEGEGFDYKSVPDPTVNENLIKPSGRGVFIIRHFSNYVLWKQGGKHLVIGFRKYRKIGNG